MSGDGADRRVAVELPSECDRLELAIRRLLEDHGGWRERACTAEARIAELETTLHGLRSGGLDPLALEARNRLLESENRALQERLAEAGKRLRRILARIDFLEAER